MTEPRTNLKRWTLLVGVTGVALEAMGTLALRWRPGRRACGSRLTSQAIGASAAPRRGHLTCRERPRQCGTARASSDTIIAARSG